ncbi:MAG: anti-sigma factor antagonist [Oscillospiraceae bacterium]|nr:anti-sigma factor antagonist [Oscillospiraceae bacterium]
MQTKLEKGTLTVYLEGRIDSQNAPQIEKELLSAVGASPDASVVLDAEKLDYISSAGLRVLLKLRKTSDKPVPVVNVSPEVYEIFSVTGFTELMEVRRRLREVSVEGLKVVGRGATATVYRIDPDTVVKVFNPGTSPAVIQQENERSRNAFVSGIPTAIAFDLVKVGDSFGSVYELLNAKDFLAVMESDKEHLDSLIRGFARLMRKMHGIKVDPAKFPPSKQNSLAALPMLGAVCTPEEIEKLRAFYETVPDRDTFIHADCHPGNVMIQNGEYVFIDLMTCGSGHPIFDMSSMCIIYHIAPSRKSPYTVNFTDEEIKLIWDSYLRGYFETDDEAFLRKAERQITAFAAARNLFAAVFVPGIMTPERLEYMKKIALDYIDEGLEPICF